ncbi:hypothetical protein [Streptomyces sp900116325]|uniref:hypothetical protein n=1 Tax=Streptomyces sp. 900116325 TaxID=3154295 RepID=UPI0033B9664C
METIAAEEINDITLEDIAILEERTWIDETYSVGATGYGQEVVVIESANGTEIFAVDTEENARKWMLQQLAGSMRVTEEPTADITFSWPAHYSDVDFAATRTDSRTGAYYSVVRIGDRIEIEEHDNAEDALVAATQGAIELAHKLNESGDKVKQIGAPHILARAYEARAKMWRMVSGARIRTAKQEGIIGRAGQITATDLAANIGGSRGLVNKILAGEDWT